MKMSVQDEVKKHVAEEMGKLRQLLAVNDETIEALCQRMQQIEQPHPIQPEPQLNVSGFVTIADVHHLISQELVSIEDVHRLMSQIEKNQQYLADEISAIWGHLRG